MLTTVPGKPPPARPACPGQGGAIAGDRRARGEGQTAYGQDQDDVVRLLPNPYALTPRLAGFVNPLYLQADSEQANQSAIRQLNETLRRRHRIAAGSTADFSVRNLSQIAETAASSGRIMALLLAAVASISLLVGGIGIMNILLVSVTE